MTDWRPLDQAPRAGIGERAIPIRLHLPGANFATDESGRPKGEVRHGECVGAWQAERSAWVDQATGNAVYPSGFAAL